MYFISNNLGDNLNNVILKKMVHGKKISFYSPLPTIVAKSKTQNEKNIDILSQIAKIDLVFIGSILETISNQSYIFSDKNDKYKSIYFS